MDLREMLNNEPSISRAPPKSLPQSSPIRHDYTSHPEPPRADYPPHVYDPASRERPPQPPPLHTTDPRSPGGSYTSAQSPYQHPSASTSTLSGGPNSYHGHSPGQGVPNQQYVAHTIHSVHSNNYNNGGFVPSPSPLVPQPTTPGSHPSYAQQLRPQSSHSAASSSPSYMHSYPPRESPAPAVTPSQHPQARQISPYIQHQSHPGTPLGPPASHQRPSPRGQRSQSDYEHVRTYSTGSYGSNPPPEILQRSQTQMQPNTPRDSITRQYSYERDRERSQSVSPKTIIHPSQQRQRLTESPQMGRMTTSKRPSHDRVMSEQRTDTVLPGRVTEQAEASNPALMLSTHQRTTSSSQASSVYQSPVPLAAKIPTPRVQHANLPGPGNPHIPNLKRGSSAVSGSSESPQPPVRKRLRYDEIPIFACSARTTSKLLRGGNRGITPVKASGPPSHVPEIVSQIKQEPNGHLNDVKIMPQEPPSAMSSMPWEPSITNTIPYEDLTRFLCDQIVGIIGAEEPPAGGAAFEIEAKLGEIQSQDEQARISMPIMTESLINKWSPELPKTRFESSMDIQQHKQMNDFLNDCLIRTRQPGRQEMTFKHIEEIDNFYELTPLGRSSLPEHIQNYANRNRNHKPRVRITTDKKTGKVEAKIIKSRIADFDVYNPRCAFDYRISVNIESPWDGPFEHLIMVNESDGRRGEREKNRMSYRHLAWQIDLTQVSYPATQRKEHELEVEVSPEVLRQQIQHVRDGQPNRYEDLVRGFVDNVRILARHFKTH